MAKQGKDKGGIKRDWQSGTSGPSLFTPEQMDIFVDRTAKEGFIFHGKPVDYNALERLEYDPARRRVDVLMKDGTRLDLGVKIHTPVHMHLLTAHEMKIVQTRDGQSLDGTVLPLSVKGRKEPG